MSAPQRRFLLRELQRLFPDPAMAQMLAAEDLAARCLEAGAPHPGEPVVRSPDRQRLATSEQTEATPEG